MGDRVSSFIWHYPLLSLRSSSSFLRLLPRFLVTSICPFIFPSIICCRRQFLRKMWPIQLAFRFFISCTIFLWSLTLSNTSPFLTWSVQLISILLQHHISKLSRRNCALKNSEGASLWIKEIQVLRKSPLWCPVGPRRMQHKIWARRLASLTKAVHSLRVVDENAEILPKNEVNWFLSNKFFLKMEWTSVI